MPCFRPLRAFWKPGGGVAFDRGSEATSAELQLPCGQCRGCRLRRSAEWALRCVHEASLHERNSFVTLTYDAEHLPRDGSLNVKHWQDFAKRLRKAVGPFRFFHCGEYGDGNLRPHYHACMFGVDFSGDRVLVGHKRGNDLFTSKLLEETWGKGMVRIGSLTFASAAYVARYVMKKAKGKDLRRYERVDVETGECYSVRPEYVTMSRRPGVGAAWLDKFHGDVYPSDEVVHEGRKFRPPRFYDSRLEEAELEVLKQRRRERAEARSEDLTPERLRVREQVAHERTRMLVRDL